MTTLICFPTKNTHVSIYSVPTGYMRVLAKMADPPTMEDAKVDISEKQTLLAVLQFLKKHNLKVYIILQIFLLFGYSISLYVSVRACCIR